MEVELAARRFAKISFRKSEKKVGSPPLRLVLRQPPRSSIVSLCELEARYRRPSCTWPTEKGS